MEIEMINIVNEVNSYRLFVANNVVDYIEKEVKDEYKVIETPVVVGMDNCDDVVDEYQNRNKIMVHDYFVVVVVVDMNVD
jgi:hypothetical protein